MTPKSLSSDFTPERCQYRTATGRQCLSPVVDTDSPFCPRHAFAQPNEFEDFLAPLTNKACRFQSAQGVNHSLGALYTLLAQGRISPRRASALAYISSLLLRTLPAIDTDLYPHSGKPGFSPSGKPTQQSPINVDHADNVDDVDAGDAALESEHPAKSQKPN